MVKPIYLDYNATTPIDPGVREAMLPYLTEQFGNPSSSHVYGRIAHDAVEKARGQVAGLIGSQPEEIVFTGGGSEASNYAIKGAVFAKLTGLVARLFQRSVHVITSSIEHPVTIQPCEWSKRLGCSLTVVPVDGAGRVDPDEVKSAISRRTVLATIMHSNNEVGTLQAIREIAAIARQAG